MESASLAEKRSAIQKYVEANEARAHQYFELEDGTTYEGYIIEVNEEVLLFEWAYSPITDNPHEQPFEIAIQQINIRSFR